MTTAILGLDPANNCGYAHNCGVRGVWKLTNKTDKHPGRRLERFRRFLFRMKRDHGIDVIAYEDASFGSHHSAVQAAHNQLAGIINLCAAEWDIPVFKYTPSHLKKWLTDSGKSTKEQMIAAVKTMFDIEVENDNVADAVTVLERVKIESIFQGAS